MFKFILGFMAALTMSISSNYIWLTTEQGTKLEKFCFFIREDIFSGDYIINPLTGRCSIKRQRNGVVEADYFKCDKFQRLINKD